MLSCSFVSRKRFLIVTSLYHPDFFLSTIPQLDYYYLTVYCDIINIIMEQYPVPQFIEEEAKMVSFLTVKQFVYFVVAGAILFILYAVLPFSLFIIAAIIVGGAAAVLGFFKIDGTLFIIRFNKIIIGKI